jgi:glycerol uptake facilitator-like aquaporin
MIAGPFFKAVRVADIMIDASLKRRSTAEFIGTAILVATVVGSGVMGEELAGGNVALALLANTLATGAVLVALILTFGGISGAHFNPAVTLADALERGLEWREVPWYIAAQLAGGLTGAAVAHLMFKLPLFSVSQHARAGSSQVFSEFIATFGLLSVIWGCSRLRANAVPFAVGAYITAAYWFTSSTSFANPAVTIARAFSNTFSGIRPVDAPAFIAAQVAGAIAATFLFRWLVPTLSDRAKDVLMPHESADQKIRTYLFACVHNAGRSQMAAAFFNLYANKRGCIAISAGTEPAKHIHPQVVDVMREIGVDLSAVKPQKLTANLAERASVLITMGCGEACPFIPGLRTLDWALRDPKGQPIESVRALRDEVHDRVKELIRTDCADCCEAVCP